MTCERETLLLEAGADILAGSLDALQCTSADIRAAWGACKSCDCTGYIKGNSADICRCKHHFSQHR